MFSHSWCLRVTIYALPQQSINSPKVTLCNIKIKYYWSLWLALNSFGLLGLKLQEIKKNDLLAQIPDQLKIIWLVLIFDHRNRIGTFRIFNVQRILQINYACGYIWKLLYLGCKSLALKELLKDSTQYNSRGGLLYVVPDNLWCFWEILMITPGRKVLRKSPVLLLVPFQIDTPLWSVSSGSRWSLQSNNCRKNGRQ